jgi:hypothetical protein
VAWFEVTGKDGASLQEFYRKLQGIHEIAAADPAIPSGMCTYEVGTMPVAIVPA